MKFFRTEVGLIFFPLSVDIRPYPDFESYFWRKELLIGMYCTLLSYLTRFYRTVLYCRPCLWIRTELCKDDSKFTYEFFLWIWYFNSIPFSFAPYRTRTVPFHQYGAGDPCCICLNWPGFGANYRAQGSNVTTCNKLALIRGAGRLVPEELSHLIYGRCWRHLAID